MVFVGCRREGMEAWRLRKRLEHAKAVGRQPGEASRRTNTACKSGLQKLSAISSRQLLTLKAAAMLVTTLALMKYGVSRATLLGRPRNRAMERTAIGPVLPESNNFNFSIPLIGLAGRGIGASLSLFYNSSVWSRHGSAVTFSHVGLAGEILRGS